MNIRIYDGRRILVIGLDFFFYESVGPFYLFVKRDADLIFVICLWIDIFIK